MKPKSIHFDGTFEKHWHKYLDGLTEKQKKRLKSDLQSLEKIFSTNGPRPID